MDFTDKFRKYAPAVNRLGITAVILWFGINQLINPDNFLGYLPDFIFSSSYAKTFIFANGILEVIAGTLLLLGPFTRFVALIMALHLLVITIELGYGDVAVRDFGLTLSTFAIALWGEDEWSIRNIIKKKKK